MKLYATYGSLGALLPDSESKKKRSAPAIIDRALEYIPELENEIEKLTLKKNNMLSKIENKQHDNQNLQLEHEAPSVLVHEVEKGEVIIQIICSPNDEKTLFSKLLQNLEAKEKGIISVSTLCVWEKRVCYHLHIRMKKDSLATDYVEVLRQDVISWLL
ncbi:transcription factor bHLH160 [Citrus clementina]|nr:transcription factor bHLH160 [Citrus x clementina]